MRVATILIAVTGLYLVGCNVDVAAPRSESAASVHLASLESTFDEEEEIIRVSADPWEAHSWNRDLYPLHGSAEQGNARIMVTLLKSAKIEHGEPLHMRVTVLSPDVPAAALWIWVDSFWRATVPAPTMRAGRGSATYILDLPIGSYHQLPNRDPNQRYLVVYPLEGWQCCPFMEGAYAQFHVTGLAEWFPPLPWE